MHGPLDERHLYHDLRLHPVRAHPRQASRLREWRRRDLQRIELRAQLTQKLRVEAGADFTGEDEVVALVVADEQRAESDASALRVGEAADDELLRRLALHLEPVRRAPMLVRRV